MVEAIFAHSQENLTEEAPDGSTAGWLGYLNLREKKEHAPM